MTAPAEVKQKVYAPQSGPQAQFLSSAADIVIYGGGAGGGKTWSLLFEPLRHIVGTPDYPNGVPGFTAVIFRRVSPQIRNEGGLWDESATLYPDFGGTPRETILEWRFHEDLPPHLQQTVRFASMQYESDKLDWQGSQIPVIGFDELTHFTEDQFFYMMSRNRSLCGVRPYMRGTCNPDADSWVADFIAWWIDQDETSPTYGLPIPERAGVVRYFIRTLGVIHWADTPEELYTLIPVPDELRGQDFDPSHFVKSCTFIPASVYDNKILLKTNPTYLGNLMALPQLERDRLLGMNWKVRASAGKVFNRQWFDQKVLAGPPEGCTRFVRFWDKAATEDAGAFTVGLKLATFPRGWVILDVVRGQWSSFQRDQIMLQVAEEDGLKTEIWVEQEPGSGGKESLEHSVKLLAGYRIRGERVTGDKIARAMPVSAQAEGGNLYMVRAAWNKVLLDELHNFPEQKLKDQVDALSGAFNKSRRAKSYDTNEWSPHYA